MTYRYRRRTRCLELLGFKQLVNREEVLKWRRLGLSCLFALGLISMYIASSYNVDNSYTSVTRVSSRHLLANETAASHGPVWEQCTFETSTSSGAWVFSHAVCILIIFVALAIICDDFFVPSLEIISEKLNLSEDVAGATFMAAGSSAPELFSSVAGVASESDVGVGTIVGSAVFNLLIIIALTAALAGQVLHLDWRPLIRDAFFYAMSIGCFIGFAWDGYFMHYEAVVLLVLYSLYIVLMVFNPRLMDWLGTWSCCCNVQVKPSDEEDVKDAADKPKDSGNHLEPESRQPSFSGGHARRISIHKQSLNELHMLEREHRFHHHRGSVAGVLMLHNLPPASRLSRKDSGFQSRENSININLDHHHDGAHSAKQRGSRSNDIEMTPKRGELLHSDSESHSEDQLLPAVTVPRNSGKTSPPPSTQSPSHPNQFHKQDSRTRILVGTKTMSPKVKSPLSPTLPPIKSVAEFEEEDEDIDSNNKSGVNNIQSNGGSNVFFPHSNLTPLPESDQNSNCSTPPITSDTVVTNPDYNNTNSFMQTTPVANGTSSKTKLPDVEEQNGETAAKTKANGDVKNDTEDDKKSEAGSADDDDEEETMSICPCLPCCPLIRTHPPNAEEARRDGGAWNWFKIVIRWILFIPAFPFVVLFSWTVPDCSKDHLKKWYIMSFIMSVFWIACLSFGMVTLVGRIGCVLNIDSYIMGLVIVAVGTSIPDALSSILVARDGYGDMAVSNAIGSNVFDINLGLGLPFLIRIAIDLGDPINLLDDNEWSDFLTGVMIVTPHAKFGFLLLLILIIALTIFFIAKFKLNKWIGISFVSMYFLFLAYAFTQELYCVRTINTYC